MAIQRRLTVTHHSVFPAGAFLVSEVEAVLDFQAAVRPDGSRPQKTDPDTGLLVWAVQVLDADEAAGKRDKTVSVKLLASHQPVPPKNATPFRSPRSSLWASRRCRTSTTTVPDRASHGRTARRA